VNRAIAVVAAIVFLSPCALYADYSFENRGTWPESWPKELEPLRKHSRTFEGPVTLDRAYAIPFTDRDEFESVWPHILKVKSKGTSIRLLRGPNFFLGGDSNAGVVIRCPPRGESDEPAQVWLVVDGDIVDLNRIPLPPDTPISDERFKDGAAKP
jgi:hypothetical protein